MSQTSVDSEPYIVCMATKKQKERGLEVISNGEKELNFLDIEIQVSEAQIREDDTMVTAKGSMKFPAGAFVKVKDNMKDRRTKLQERDIEK